MLVNGEEVETAIKLVEVEAADRLPWVGYWCQTSRIVLECASICKEEEKGLKKPISVKMQQFKCWEVYSRK